MTTDPWTVNADDARVIRQDDAMALRLAINAEEALRRRYKGGIYPALEPGDPIDVNSMYPAVMRECFTLGHALHVVDGVLKGDCLRCGADLGPDLPSSPVCPIHGEGCEVWA